MMERKPWTRRAHQLPLRFRDLLPLPPPPLPPPSHCSVSVTVPPSQSMVNDGVTSLPSGFGSLGRRLRQVFTTQRNIFGLSRQYNTIELPTHDPEEHNPLSELSDIPARSSVSTTLPTFHPYPNLNSFRLGDWYWNGGIQKSQSSFNDLLKIIGDREFDPADIRDTRWDHINNTLASDGEIEWLDEDAGWTRTPVTISVPYHPRRGVPLDPHACPRDFTVTDFYHRNLVSVIREKLSNKGASIANIRSQ